MFTQKLPPEIQQAIVGYLDFISLLKLRDTNTAFRDLVNTSLSKPGIILPARAELLELYLEVQRRPSYRTYEYDLDDEEPFCGEEYLSTIRAQISLSAPDLRIPAAFECWVLEWPQNEALGWFWLSQLGVMDNLLPLEKGMGLLHDSLEADATVVGLFVDSHGCQDYTILFLEGLGERSGKVWKGDICQMIEIEDEEEEEDDSEEEEGDWEEEEGDNMAESWTEWLRTL
ncbi:hypothetical protein V8E51_016087 [Hyaloscypha variabilis]|jgi:hypothetical protein